MWGALYGEMIIKGRYTYAFVVSKRPYDKADIDAYLTEQGRTDLITATA